MKPKRREVSYTMKEIAEAWELAFSKYSPPHQPGAGQEEEDKMNIYDHEDAFKAANLHVGKVIDLLAGLKCAKDLDQARVIIGTMQGEYEKLFDTFIAGVAWARDTTEGQKP